MPLVSSIKNKPLWGFDIETAGKNNDFVMCSIIGDDNIKQSFYDRDDFTDYLIKKAESFRHGYICATNLGFDILGILRDSEHIKNFYPLIRGSSMISAVIMLDKYRKLRFIDSMNYAPFSVEKWGKILNLPKLSRPKCFSRYPESTSERMELEAYNMRDSEITYKAMKFLQSNFNALGCNMKLTIASTAMDLFRRKYLKRPLFQPDIEILQYLYKGYYGGRTEAIKRGRVKNLNKYDVNSLYPFAMLNEYPDPNFMRYCSICRNDIIYKYEGLCEARIEAPFSYIPYLPVRHGELKKLLFPCGDIKGYYTLFELRKAIEHGYKLKKIYSAVIYTKTSKPFYDYITSLYDRRLIEQKKKSPNELIFKLLMNCLYGKWAQKIDNKESIIHKDNVTYAMIKASKAFFRAGDFFVFNAGLSYIPKFVNPIFSIYTTAYARDILYNLIDKSQKQVYYFDTDSLFTRHEHEVSSALGSLKFEGFIKEGIIVKPKMYILDDMAKCKGVSHLDQKGFMEIIEKKIAPIERFVKFKEANRRGLKYNQTLSFDKHISLEDDKRLWNDRFDFNKLQDSEAITI